MRIDPNTLRNLLEQPNHTAWIEEPWLNYFKCYGLDEIVANYNVEVGLLQRQSVYQHYRQKQHSIGTCVIVHGYMDHSAIYRHLIADRLAFGWDVLIYDKIGHGLSTGESYAIDSFVQYAQQLQSILEYLAAHCDKKWQLIGQSTGASVIMEHALNPIFKPFKQITQRVLLAPLVRNCHFNKVKFQYQILRFFLKRIKRGVSNNSHYKKFLNFIYQDDPLTSRWVKVSWVGAMLNWERCLHTYSQSLVPLVVIQGDGDETVDWIYNLKVIKQIFPKSQQHIIQGAKHHLVNEGDKWRGSVFALLNSD